MKHAILHNILLLLRKIVLHLPHLPGAILLDCSLDANKIVISDSLFKG